MNSDRVQDRVFIPKFYDPEIDTHLDRLRLTMDCRSLSNLIEDGLVSVGTGDEVGKMAYGTGDIPFVRTSDISNWELKTAPKQGVSEDIYDEYAAKQDVRTGDILIVRDGTYLIGTNCLVSRIDTPLLYQSHIVKIRVERPDELDPEVLFLAINSSIVQRQFRSFQFTADIIDTMGRRVYDTIIPLPKNQSKANRLGRSVRAALRKRVNGKAFVKHCAHLIEEALESGTTEALEHFEAMDDEEVEEVLTHETVTSEFGEFEAYWRYSDNITNHIYIPRYYEPSIQRELDILAATCDLASIAELEDAGALTMQTGDEIGKMAYGTGDIPFIRTSDFANWEIKHNRKQGISPAIYREYADKQDVAAGDIFLVRDGTYLIGASCIITNEDSTCLYSGGLIKLRALDRNRLDPYLLLGLLNSYIVKRQIRTKQFTRDVIDTLGPRLGEVILPIPKSADLRHAITKAVRKVVSERINGRIELVKLAGSYDDV